MRTFVVLVSLISLCAGSCGGKSKNKPVEPTPIGQQGGMGPGGGGGGGGAMYGGVYGYGGDTYGGGYGGGGGYGYGGGYAARGVFDCVSGIPECDVVFQKYIGCINTSKAQALADENARKQVIDSIQQMCEGIKASASDQSSRATMVQACTDMNAQGAQMASQLQCTW